MLGLLTAGPTYEVPGPFLLGGRKAMMSKIVSTLKKIAEGHR